MRAIEAHLRGGGWHLDGQTIAIPDPLPELLIPYKRDFWSEPSTVRFVRRERRNTPASWLRRHGPDAWLYDWEHRRRKARRAFAQAYVPEDLLQLSADAFVQVVCLTAEAILRELDQCGTYDRRDLEWRVHHPPGAADLPLRLMRAEVVMEVPV